MDPGVTLKGATEGDSLWSDVLVVVLTTDRLLALLMQHHF